MQALPESNESGGAAPGTTYKLFVYGKYQDPLFQMYRVAAEYLSQDRRDVEATVEGFLETQYEQQLRYIINKYGGPFVQSKPSAPLIYAETSENKVLYFLNEKRFCEWAYKRFKYEDNTRLIFYKRIGNKMLQAVKEGTGRTYCALGFSVGDDPQETVHLELFDEECPELCRNFLDLLQKPEFQKHFLHRVKAGAWIQGGDIVDGSGRNSEAAAGDGSLMRHESFNILHDRAGLLGMANHGKDTNGSQFYITLRELSFLDGKSVIFGRVISGMRTVLKISKAATKNERPIQDIKVEALPEFTSVGVIQKQVDQKAEDAATKMQAIARGRADRKKVDSMQSPA